MVSTAPAPPGPVPRGATVAVLMIFTVFLSLFIPGLLFSKLAPGTSQTLPFANTTGMNDEEHKPRLTLTSANSFKLVIFSDLHYGEEEHGWGIEQDANSTSVMRSVLSDESPQLVVVNGDLITGENTFKENASDYVHQIVAPMVSANTPWASTYGNHDSKLNLSRERTYATEKTYPLSYTRHMDPSLPGVTNYYLLLYAHGSDGIPVAVLWFFDSRGGGTYQRASAAEHDDIPNWVADETAAWFIRASAQLRQAYSRPLPSLAFVHIPPHVFLSTQQAGLDPANFPGTNDDVPAAIEGTGIEGGEEEDAAFVDALLAEELLHSVYVGHDHGNAWCGSWPEQGKGPFLCFSKHTGYGGYGGWRRGARVLQLTFANGDAGDMAVDTWVRLENGGGVVTRVTLNATYGVDRYPTADGEPGS